MNRLLLDDLQRRRAFPSVTVLVNTRPGATIDPTDQFRLDRLVARAAQRVALEAPGAAGEQVVQDLRRLAAEQLDGPAPTALALCASPELSVVVRLGSEVRERVVVDDTFATRDLVADLARTARFRVVAVSEHKVRLFLGDRSRLVEALDEQWPLLREDHQGPELWGRHVFDRLRAEHAARPLPTVLVGVERTVSRVGAEGALMVVARVHGSHDRTPANELHSLVWPQFEQVLAQEHDAALRRLERARSSRRYAGGIDEVWSLANDGRVDLVVVDESYEVAALVGPGDELVTVEDPAGVGVVDDIVDDTIEAVLQRGGRAVLVPPDHLGAVDRIAAVLRY